ncbi:MAG: bifunctional demethylmenaquinone methyltransferase/2-methoxy-6-polyprenyl-1,4-benzoquinol methylase UbiE [Bacteroidetes bacterium]|nr:bifunctional demethylmenaquinone methyltransferase/2-methoxy-6-polyprenyl-1,4-benzoquinol methylase UbiE [Bacteroidota bacterium]
MQKKQQVKRIFDSISHKYDLLNHLLSAGIDVYWRKRAIKLTKFEKDAKLLDIACGTGDFAISAKKAGIKEIVGADLSANMLNYFHKKAEWSIGNAVQSVAESLPFKSDSFSNITVAFGVRNFYDIPMAFQKFREILIKNGKVTILEFRLPTNKLVRGFYLFYFNRILPFVGRIISSDKEAYTYLPESVDEFDKKVDLIKLLKEAGFSEVERHSLTFGIVQIVIGKK